MKSSAWTNQENQKVLLWFEMAVQPNGFLALERKEGLQMVKRISKREPSDRSIEI